MIDKIRNKILFFATCAFCLICLNFANAQIIPIDMEKVSNQGSEYIQQGIKTSVEILKDFQKVIYNFYNTKIAPKASFWARDIQARFKAGIMSAFAEKLSELRSKAVEKFYSFEIIKKILEFFNEKQSISAAGY